MIGLSGISYRGRRGGIPNVGSQTPSLVSNGYRSANYSYTANAVIQNNTVDFDPSSIYSTGAYSITPNLSGYYLASMRCDYTTTGSFDPFIFKNGSAYKYLGFDKDGAAQGGGGSCLVYCDGASDVLKAGSTRTGTLLGTKVYTYLNAIGPFNQSAFQVASAYLSANSSSSTGALAKLAFDTALFDPTGIFNSGSNRFQPTKAGYYIVGARTRYVSFSATTYQLAVYKNGSIHQYLDSTSTTAAYSQGGHCVVYLNGSSDYVEIYHRGSSVVADAAVAFAEIVGPFNGVVCSSYLSGSGSLTSGTTSEIAQDAVLYDTASVWNGTTKRFVPNQAGYYWCTMRGECTTEAVHETAVYKNGAALQTIGGYCQSNTYAMGGAGVLVYMNGTTDYLEPFAYRSTSGTLVAGSDKTWFSMIGPF